MSREYVFMDWDGGPNRRDYRNDDANDYRVFGTDDNDRVMFGDGDDAIWTGGGDDRAYGGAGDDKFYNGGGRDVLVGGAGDDHFNVRGDSDTFVYGGAGDDSYYVGLSWGLQSGDTNLTIHGYEEGEVLRIGAREEFIDFTVEQIGNTALIQFERGDDFYRGYDHFEGTIALSNTNIDDLNLLFG